ncbi:MAG: ABC transporter substrate-binding protein, partial [Parvibaculales bacterium]
MRILIFPFFLFFFSINIAYSAERISLLLDWFANPDHAPIFIAQNKGFFREAGLEVKLIEPADPSLPPKLVAAGKADLAISYQPQLQLHVAEGLKITRIATLIATPLNSLVVLKDGPIDSIKKLRGKKIGYSVGGFEDILLGAILEKENIGLDEVQLVNVNFSLTPSLLSGNVDAVIGAFRNFELTQIELAGFQGKAFFLEEHGIPNYDELIIIANSKKIKNHAYRQKLIAFVDALERAVTYLINHPEESWKLFIQDRKDLDTEL